MGSNRNKINTIMKTIIKKIHKGYYKGNHKGFEFTISKVDDIQEIAWYFQIGDIAAHDWHVSKKIAILAAIDYIDNIA